MLAAQTEKTVAHVLPHASARLAGAGIGSAKLDARLLLQHCLNLGHAALIGAHDRELSPEEMLRFDAMLARRVAREPVARIVGGREFFGRWFEVSRDVLDPRPETELLVEMILADHTAKTALTFADVGVGSGAISLSLLAERAGWTAIGSDVSVGALDCANRNAAKLGVSNRFHPVRSDLLKGLEGTFDFIVSNPPYISSLAIDDLEPEVVKYDPVLSLDGGGDGLAFYRRLLGEAPGFIKPAGRLYVEIGSGQHDQVNLIAEAAGWRRAGQVSDYGGHIRHLAFQR